MTSLLTWMHVLAATSSVVVLALSLSRHGTPAFRVPLAALAIDQFIWNSASVALELTGDVAYSWVGAVVTPVFAAVLLHYALVFTGKARRFHSMLLAAYALYAIEAVIVLIDWASASLDLGLGVHARIAAITAGPLALFGGWLLRRHLSEVVSSAERVRTWLFVVVLLVGVPLLLTDLLHDAGFPVPSLATGGSTVINGTLITIALDVSRTSRRQQLAQAVLFALFVVVAFLSLFLLFRDHQGLLVLAVTALTIALGSAASLAFRLLARRREGLERFATFGRFSAQMAHDLKNPLAAARGAAELLEGELRGLDQETLRHFSELLVQQLDRLTAIIDRYQRLSSLELERRELDVNALVSQVLSLQAFASRGDAKLEQRLAPTLPPASVDAELFSSALENLVKNAFEALDGKPGTVTVATAATSGGGLSVSVTDTGPGIDPRTKEQLFSLFFTTKAQGSGLGLAFVQQIARAHGGDVRLDSREGHGTRVDILLPGLGQQ